MKRHLCTMSKLPSVAQVSNFQIKLDSTSAIIDTILLVPRQIPWKATPYLAGTGTSTDTTTTTNTDTTQL
jgi:hypothetical protein